MLISHVSIVLVRLTSHLQLDMSRSRMSNAFFHGEGFHVNGSWTRFNPDVQFGDIRVFQAWTCDQRFEPDASALSVLLRTWRFAQVRLLPFSFLTTWWWSLCQPILCTPTVLRH